MKKFLALILAMLMMMSMATTAAAETVSAAGGTSTAAVTGTCVEGLAESPITYSVDISWTDLSFTYEEENAPTWDPVNHKYNGDAREAGWVDKTATATIVNHSNTAVMAGFTYAANSGYETAGMQFGANELYVASAEDGSQKTGSNTVKPTGYLPKNTENVEIGSITITITKAEDMTKDEAASNAMNLRTTAASYYMSAVDNADGVASGEEYILKADASELADYVDAQYSAIQQSATDAEATAIYYAMKAAVENFEATKIYTKA